MPARLFNLLLVILLFLTINVSAIEPARRGFLGWYGKMYQGRFQVDSILKGSTAFQLGIQTGDQLKTINHQTIRTLKQIQSLPQSLRENQTIHVSWLRNGKPMEASGSIIGQPLADISWADRRGFYIPWKQGLLKSWVYYPRHLNKQKIPAILFIPGYNCQSVEAFPANYNGKLIQYWVEQGWAVLTVEKGGVGDSYQCEPCQTMDLSSEIHVFQTAYTFMSHLSDIDTQHLFIWGHSMGGIIAPLLNSKPLPRGILVYGTVFRPWSEFLLEMHRVQKPLLDSLSYLQTEAFMDTIQQIYYDFFVMKKSPAGLYKNPKYRNLLRTELEYDLEDDLQWGRHWKFWQQLDSVNMALAWQQTETDVLVMHGLTDYIQCSSLEPKLITATVNERYPGRAELYEFPDMDHLLMKSSTLAEAVKHFQKKAYMRHPVHIGFLEKTGSWIRERCQ